MAKKSSSRQFYENSIRDEINEIRQMFAVLKRCFDGLADKSGIEEDRLRFDGFDALNESDYYNVAHDIARISNEPTIDSHSRRLGWYQLLVKRWRDSADKQNLTKKDLIRITAPSER
jgi:uncharacterized protein YfbU (UPF0304 family)